MQDISSLLIDFTELLKTLANIAIGHDSRSVVISKNAHSVERNSYYHKQLTNLKPILEKANRDKGLNSKDFGNLLIDLERIAGSMEIQLSGI